MPDDYARYEPWSDHTNQTIPCDQQTNRLQARLARQSPAADYISETQEDEHWDRGSYDVEPGSWPETSTYGVSTTTGTRRTDDGPNIGHRHVARTPSHNLPEESYGTDTPAGDAPIAVISQQSMPHSGHYSSVPSGQASHASGISYSTNSSYGACLGSGILGSRSAQAVSFLATSPSPAIPYGSYASDQTLGPYPIRAPYQYASSSNTTNYSARLASSYSQTSNVNYSTSSPRMSAQETTRRAQAPEDLNTATRSPSTQSFGNGHDWHNYEGDQRRGDSAQTYDDAATEGRGRGTRDVETYINDDDSPWCAPDHTRSCSRRSRIERMVNDNVYKN